MSESGDTTSVPNGTGGSALDPMQRLSSFKTPRDLSLGGVKPNKKVFTPNLNVSRNKNKGGLPTITRDKRVQEQGQRDKKNNRNKNQVRNGPNIIKSSGVFSEGMGLAERKSVRSSYGREAEAAPTMQKPTIRVKDVWKIDKELEQQKINKVMGDDGSPSSEEEVDDARQDKDAPVKLPFTEGGWLHSKPKAVIKAKPELIIKEEPQDLDGFTPSVVEETKVKPDVKKEPFEDMDIVSLLRGDKPTLIMLQFPDSLPGRGASAAAVPPSRRPRANQEPQDEGPAAEPKEEEKPEDERCRLSDLSEGRIGKLLIHRSGRVRLALGDTMFEVAAGTQAAFRQEVVSVAADPETRSANLIALGNVPHKLNLLPHWETMLRDISL